MTATPRLAHRFDPSSSDAFRPFRAARKAGFGRRTWPGPDVMAPLDAAILGELRDVLGAARLDQLLALLAAELEERPAAIRGAVADRDYPAAAAQAVSLTGAAANLGASSVSGAAATLRQAILSAAGGDSRSLAPSLRRLERAAQGTRNALGELRRATAPALADA